MRGTNNFNSSEGHASDDIFLSIRFNTSMISSMISALSSIFIPPLLSNFRKVGKIIDILAVLWYTFKKSQHNEVLAINPNVNIQAVLVGLFTLQPYIYLNAPQFPSEKSISIFQKFLEL